MKQIITTGLLLLTVAAASARSNTGKKSLLNKTSNLENAKMIVTGDNVKFTNLPKQHAEMYILDEQGIVEQSGMVSRAKNNVNMAELPKGKHTIALKVGLKVKVFGYMAEVVIKG